MNFLVDQLIKQVSGGLSNEIGKQIGGSSVQTQNALSQFIPIMTQALAKNTQTSSGAGALFNALQNDHDGGILDNIAGFLGNASSGPGKGILGHVFSNQLGGVNNFISESTGLSPQATSSLMEIAAPIIMGYLGKQRSQNNMNQNGLVDLLMNSSKSVQSSDPKNNSMISALLDGNNDGSMVDDVAKIGVNLLSSWMSGRS